MSTQFFFFFCLLSFTAVRARQQLDQRAFSLISIPMAVGLCREGCQGLTVSRQEKVSLGENGVKRNTGFELYRKWSLTVSLAQKMGWGETACVPIFTTADLGQLLHFLKE